MLVHSSLVDGVLLALSRDHSADVTGDTFAREVLTVHHDFSHSVYLDHRLRLKRTLPVSRNVYYQAIKEREQEIILTRDGASHLIF